MGLTKVKIIYPSKKATHAEVLAYGRNVYSGTNGNAVTFPAPTPTMSALNDELDAYEEAMPAEIDISPAIDATLNVFRNKIMKILFSVGDYVLYVAKGDRTIAGLSGFELNKATTESNSVTDLVIKSVTPGMSIGTAHVRLDGRSGCNFYLVERKFGVNDWRIIDGFDTVIYQLDDLPSGDVELRFWGRRGDEETPNKVTVTVRIL